MMIHRTGRLHGQIGRLRAAVSTSVGTDRIGSVSGLNNAVRQVGGVLGIAMAALVFTGTGSFVTTATAAGGFRNVAVLCAGVAAAGAVAGGLGARSVARRHLQVVTSTE